MRLMQAADIGMAGVWGEVFIEFWGREEMEGNKQEVGGWGIVLTRGFGGDRNNDRK